MPAPLTLHYHPFASYCMKALIALYENGTPFERNIVDLGDPAQAAALKKLWPVGKFPVLQDTEKKRVIPESTIIIEYLDQHYPGATRFIPADPDRARQTRLRDRFYDNYLHDAMQRIVGDRLRPPESKDPFGVAQWKEQLHSVYAMIEGDINDPWAMGADFSLADCAAAPALHYADMVVPLGNGFPKVSAYLARLKARPSFARVLEEARPFADFFPQE